MVSYCSLSNDRLLTKILIENSSKISSRNGHQFVNTCEWVDGLDQWDFNQKTSFSRQYCNFDENIGIYLPKLNSKGINIPERLRQLIKKEENACEISLSDQSLSLSNEQLSTSDENQISKSFIFIFLFKRNLFI